MKRIVLFILVIASLILLLPFTLFKFLSTQTIFDVYDRKTSEINRNVEGYSVLFTQIFDNAEICASQPTVDCTSRIQEQIKAALRTDNLYFPEYFIRLTNEGIMQKLFLSGELVETKPTTVGEVRVRDFIEGKDNNLFWNTWRSNSSDSTMIFLKDLYSEAEIIIPFKQGLKIKGVVVYLFGD